MKKIRFGLLALLAGLFLSACEEKLVIITPMTGSGGGTPGEQKRAVLAEELTGVRCPNCPEGTAALVALDKQYGERLVVVSIHAALGYDVPYPNSQYDFRTGKGTELANYIGSAFFFPCAAINRRIVPPETEPYLPRQVWPGIIAEELEKPLAVKIDLETTFDAGSRKLDISADLTPLESLSGEHRFTVMITQDSIVDVQKVDLATVPEYTHRHILRSIITQASGDPITEPLTSGSPIKKTYSITLPAAWDAKHCSVVAVVSRGGTPNKEVLQVVEKHIIE
ncbi:MAG: Omp28-related outer membrane protein [Saprospiraceae bacterium]